MLKSDLERILQEFIPHSASYCIPDLMKALLALIETSSKLFQDTVVNAIRLWAKQQEAIDKFGDITLSEVQDDINEVAYFIVRKVKRLTQK